MTTIARLRLGTRGSALALWQANWIAARLSELNVETEQILIKTEGDVKSGPLGDMGGQGLFTKEIQRALLDNEIDLAVHSLKDLPTDSVDGLTLAAAPLRESNADMLISPKADSVATLADSARVGTGSMRRLTQLLHVRKDLEILDLRGNVDTRLQKLNDGQYDAIVLAEAGLKRLGLVSDICHVIPLSVMLPAVGQGALGIEARSDDLATLEILSKLDHAPSRSAVLAERAMLSALRGGCLAPVGAWGRFEDSLFKLDGVVLSSDGSKRIDVSVSGSAEQAEDLGRQAADLLLAQGAAALIAESRQTN